MDFNKFEDFVTFLIAILVPSVAVAINLLIYNTYIHMYICYISTNIICKINIKPSPGLHCPLLYHQLTQSSLLHIETTHQIYDLSCILLFQFYRMTVQK